MISGHFVIQICVVYLVDVINLRRCYWYLQKSPLNDVPVVTALATTPAAIWSYVRSRWFG